MILLPGTNLKNEKKDVQIQISLQMYLQIYPEKIYQPKRLPAEAARDHRPVQSGGYQG